MKKMTDIRAKSFNLFSTKFPVFSLKKRFGSYLDHYSFSRILSLMSHISLNKKESDNILHYDNFIRNCKFFNYYVFIVNKLYFLDFEKSSEITI